MFNQPTNQNQPKAEQTLDLLVAGAISAVGRWKKAAIKHDDAHKSETNF